MPLNLTELLARTVVPRKGDVDRNWQSIDDRDGIQVSSPARGTWIEISRTWGKITLCRVVPRKGDVDRNGWIISHGVAKPVVPRKGDVDRNASEQKPHGHTPVVPRKGDVDRNPYIPLSKCQASQSSPARGTWIEMSLYFSNTILRLVVPRKGDVDRNSTTTKSAATVKKSSPARGTWIEITSHHDHRHKRRQVVPRKGDVDRNGNPVQVELMQIVVPRKGDVDRNPVDNPVTPIFKRRPPQGGRG